MIQPGGSQAITLAHIHRETAGDRAALDLAAAIGLKRGANRAALRREAAAQFQRQVDAECRRRWKTLTPNQRKQWERHAAEQVRDNKRRQSIASATAATAVRLAAALQPMAIVAE